MLTGVVAEDPKEKRRTSSLVGDVKQRRRPKIDEGSPR